MNESFDIAVEKALSVLSAGMPLHVRFNRHSGTKTVWSSKPFTLQMQNSHIEPKELIIFPNQGLMTLNDRFSLYKAKNYDYIMNCLYYRKKARIERNKAMRKRRTILLPDKKLCLMVSDEFEHSGFEFQSNVPFVPGTKNKQKNGNTKNQSFPGGNSDENATAFKAPVNFVKRKLYQCKRKRLFTKEDLDNELDEYMADVKLAFKAPVDIMARSYQCKRIFTKEDLDNELDVYMADINSVFKAPVDIMERSLYQCKRRRFLTKEDLDNELDEYMADVKLIGEY